MIIRIAFLIIINSAMRVRITVIVAAAGCMVVILIFIVMLVVDYGNGRSNVAGVNVRAETTRGGGERVRTCGTRITSLRYVDGGMTGATWQSCRWCCCRCCC